MEPEVGMPYEWQLELLRRFTALAPFDRPRGDTDPNQGDLFLTNQ